jgi:hypothetical protein
MKDNLKIKIFFRFMIFFAGDFFRKIWPKNNCQTLQHCLAPDSFTTTAVLTLWSKTTEQSTKDFLNCPVPGAFNIVSGIGY